MVGYLAASTKDAGVPDEVIARAGARGMVTLPGVFTATEALLAAKAGASGLKFFPASVLGASPSLT